jgi:hypothetical protein
MKGFKYRSYWIEEQPEGDVWIFEGPDPFEYPDPIKVCDSVDSAAAWIELITD